MCLLLLQEPRLMIAPRSIAQGDQAIQQGKSADARTAYRPAIEAQPNEPIIIERLSKSAITVRRPDMAALFLRQLVQHKGWSPALYQTAANIQRMQDAPFNASDYLYASLTD